jgi:hypothetical protein
MGSPKHTDLNKDLSSSLGFILNYINGIETNKISFSLIGIYGSINYNISIP